MSDAIDRLSAFIAARKNEQFYRPTDFEETAERVLVEALHMREQFKAQAVPDGYVLVPVEPTGAMVTAGADAVSDDYDDGNDQRHREVARFAYKRMLAAQRGEKGVG